ncbi:MAG: OFA family MFS transporter, partial [Oscillospiraceae bacterium]
MDLKKKRWYILAASCLINLCIGSLYAWSVFATPMATHLSTLLGLAGDKALTAGSLAMVFTVANAVGPITLISGGAINDRLGPKWVIFTGGVLFGAGMVLSGFSRSVPMLILGYGILCGLAMGLVYGSTVGNAIKFFPDRRGLVGGIAAASYGLSSVVVPPIANGLIDALGVVAAFILLGCVFLLVICLCSFFIQKCPAGYCPDGWTPPQTAGRPSKDKIWKQMLADPIFYVMLLMLCCGAFFGLMTISQVSPIAQKMMGMTTGAATLMVSVLALFNTAGRVVCGYISDKFGRI